MNTAPRLEHQCHGGEAIISEAVLADPEAREALAGREVTADSATLRGLNEPVRIMGRGLGIAWELTRADARQRIP